MSAIDLAALISFGILIVSWAVLPSAGWKSKIENESSSLKELHPVRES